MGTKLYRDPAIWDAEAVIADLTAAGHMVEDTEGVSLHSAPDSPAVALTERGRAAACMLVNALLLSEDPEPDRAVSEAIARLIARMARGDGMVRGLMEAVATAGGGFSTVEVFTVDAGGECEGPTLN